MSTSPSSEIRIPQSLLPKDGRFGSGPSKVRTEAIAALAEAAPDYMGTSHRRPGVKSVVAELRAGLAELFSLPSDYTVALGLGGATFFWDIATFSLIQERSQHCSFGEFSSKFATAAKEAPHLGDPEILTAPPGTYALPVASDAVDAYALTHNETSTGVAMPIERPLGAEGLVLVDGTSAAGGLRVDPTQFDAYYFSPQKAFGADGGLWFALMSPAAVDRVARITQSKRWTPASLDLSIALSNSVQDQTYNTPALATLFLMADQLRWMLSHGGLEWTAARCDESAGNLYGWAEKSEYATPFVEIASQRSHVVGTIDFVDEIDAAQVAKVLRANGILDTEPYRKLGRNQLRVAMFPGIDPSDVAALCASIDHVVAALA